MLCFGLMIFLQMNKFMSGYELEIYYSTNLILVEIEILMSLLLFPSVLDEFQNEIELNET